jgi:transcriptional regulator with XRE-family HTH domain
MRAKLPHGKQRQFIDSILQANDWTLAELAKRCGIGKTTLVYWRQERHYVPVAMLQKLSTVSGIPHPAIDELIDDNERRRKGGRISQQRRHEEPERYPQLDSYQKQIIHAPKSQELAEFIGIMLGDGGIWQYQATITLNLHEEREYAEFVADLAKTLFGIEATVMERPEHGAIVVVISAVALVRYLIELGLVEGNKVTQQCGIPEWIFENDMFMRACTRGMMDTDGCVYHHTYTIRGKEYSYVKMTYAGRSMPMMEGLKEMLHRLRYEPGEVRKPGYLSISSDSAVRRYYEQDIGTHNPYHWRRYCEAVEAIKNV